MSDLTIRSNLARSANGTESGPKTDPRSLSLDDSLKLARGYKTGKNALHMALAAAINQLFKGNPDWMTQVFAAAELTVKRVTVTDKGESKTTTMVHGDGQVVWGYLRSYLELGDMIRWDSGKGRFKMGVEWQDVANSMDVAELWHRLSTVRWDKWNAKSAEEVFDAAKAVDAFLKRLNSKGIPPHVAAEMVAKAAKAA